MIVQIPCFNQFLGPSIKTVDPRLATGREINITGWLLGTSRRGIDHGFAYLANTLKRDEGVGHSTYTFWNECIDDDPDILDGKYTIKRVGLLEGPAVLDEYRTFPSPCFAREVEFTLFAEHPWLWKDPEGLIVTQLTDITTDPWTRTFAWEYDYPDDQSLVSTMQVFIDNSANNIPTNPVFVTGAPMSWMGTGGEGCPPNRVQRPPMGIAVVARPGEIIMLDGSTRTAYKLNDALCPIGIAENVALMDGSQYLWPEIAACDTNAWCFGVWAQDATPDIVDVTMPLVTVNAVSRRDG